MTTSILVPTKGLRLPFNPTLPSSRSFSVLKNSTKTGQKYRKHQASAYPLPDSRKPFALRAGKGFLVFETT